jgi:hypothetical protein
MEDIRKLMDDHPVICAVICTVIVMVILYYVLVKEGFAKEFTPAPIANQRSAGILGVGQPIRFSTEFSSANQGRGNLVDDLLRNKENLVGNMEFPSIPPLDKANYTNFSNQASGAKNSTEDFSARAMYKEYYTDKVDNRLKEILAGN